MKLINCSELKLEEFFGSDIPPYAILSHTWEKEEVTYQDFIGHAGDRTKLEGWNKIERTIALAMADGHAYCWIDTCCIDKRSSAELTEAINSMFKWYLESQICYVYLCDFDRSIPETLPDCRWFGRGWTLQELIAPSKHRFYDKSWNFYGDKIALHTEISKITGVDDTVLSAGDSFDNDIETYLFTLPVCKRMSWAAKRSTKREEDIAYSLLGIFGVNMPMLYGEGGEKAFMRLQEQIIKDNNDLTILAWEDAKCDKILARSPVSFVNGGKIQSNQSQRYNPEFQLTNKGLRINVRLWTRALNPDFNFLNLKCYDTDQPPGTGPLGLYLLQITPNIYRRINNNLIDMRQHLARSLSARGTIYIQNDNRDWISKSWSAKRYRIISILSMEQKYKMARAEPSSRWRYNYFETGDMIEFAGFLKCVHRTTKKSFALICGFSRRKDLYAGITTPESNPDVWKAVLNGEMDLLCDLMDKTGLDTTYDSITVSVRTEETRGYVEVRSEGTD
ncbi:heterokaryon incompatibility protein-domain-containing protein [Hypoxylon cercidicola]|nr:heterokaryon incompatibility protein-domain-containing protein [Hypoxylon cercidicola]